MHDRDEESEEKDKERGDMNKFPNNSDLDSEVHLYSQAVLSHRESGLRPGTQRQYTTPRPHKGTLS